MTKKGVLGLSMQTIIIMVIGVTLLILGLVFVTNMFRHLDRIADVTFDKAHEQLKNLYDESDVAVSTLPGDYLGINEEDYNSLYVWVSNQQTAAKSCNIQLLLGGNAGMLDVPATQMQTDSLAPREGTTKTFRIKALSSFPYKQEKLIQIQSDCGQNGLALTEVYLRKE